MDLKFWKKEKDDSFEDYSSFGRSRGGYGPSGQPSYGQQPTYDNAQSNIYSSTTPTSLETVKKDIEVLNSKIDTLKSYLESITQKLAMIESKLTPQPNQTTTSPYPSQQPYNYPNNSSSQEEDNSGWPF